MSTTNVMVIDGDHQVCRLLGSILENEGVRVVLHQSAQDGLAMLRSRPIDVLFTDLRIGDAGGVSVVAEARKACPHLSVVAMTDYASLESSVNALRSGAVDYMSKPFRAEQVVQALARASSAGLQQKSAAASAGTSAAANAQQVIVAHSPSMREALVLAKRVAHAEIPVLVTGERGVGKELILRAIHGQSPRSAAPLIRINCGAVQEEQLEAMLFGDQSAGPSGAGRPGALEQAGSGMVFLHNVSEMPKWMQARLYQVFQTGFFCRLGSNAPIPLAARIAASTTEDLRPLVASGRFFHELYYYLHVVPIHVPALRERREDIAPLADQFLDESLQIRAAGRCIPRLALAKDAHRALESYAWPGNVYELSNLVRRAVVFATGNEITGADLTELIPPPASREAVETITIPYAGDLKLIERSIVSEVINRHNGNKSAAARALGLHRKTLYRILDDERTGPAAAPVAQG